MRKTRSNRRGEGMAAEPVQTAPGQMRVPAKLEALEEAASPAKAKEAQLEEQQNESRQHNSGIRWTTHTGGSTGRGTCCKTNKYYHSGGTIWRGT
jgi:hypothetical protein